MKAEAIFNRLEKAGYTVVTSELSSTTGYAVRDGEIVIVDVYKKKGIENIFYLPISKKNIAPFIRELQEVVEAQGEIIAGRRLIKGKD